MPYYGVEAAMSKRELITRELDQMPEQDLDKLLAFLSLLKETNAEKAMTAMAASRHWSRIGSRPRRMRPGPVCKR